MLYRTTIEAVLPTTASRFTTKELVAMWISRKSLMLAVYGVLFTVAVAEAAMLVNSMI